MSLKIEQKLDAFYFTEISPRVYTTGAFLVPMEISKNGKKRFVWVVDEINDDIYDTNGKCCSISVYSDKKESLFPKSYLYPFGMPDSSKPLKNKQ